MKVADVIEGGITGAATLSLLQEALHKVDETSPRPFLHKSKILKKLRSNKKAHRNSSELYVKLAGELLSHAAVFGLTGLGKKKNALLRGGLLGAAAGLGAAFLTNDAEPKLGKNGFDHDGKMMDEPGKDDVKEKVLTVGLYTVGGILAGAAIKALNSKAVKKSKLYKTLKKGKNVQAKLAF